MKTFVDTENRKRIAADSAAIATRSIDVARAAPRLTLMLAGALLGAASLLPASPALVWNFTDSVPLGLYRIEDVAPEPGDLVVLEPKGAVRDALIASGALAEGRLLLKPLVAHSGDTVCREGLVVTVNSVIVAKARTSLPHDRPLPQWSGCRRLLGDEYFLISSHPDSFDSRYFGPAPAQQVVGIARPVMLLPSSREAS